ncbi:MAG: phosphoenolpyruvate synthase [Nanoarchaeota archaeon]|nr:phosphoenolpyruvate synthase [Nanoarchaeota archaeon]
MKSQELVLWFKDIGIEDIHLVGGKNASLGEMFQKLTKKRINIPDGFAVTASAYQHFLKEEQLEPEIRRLIHNINPKSVESLRKYGHEIREHMLRADIPPKLRIAIIDAYRKLQRKYGKNREVAVRSSATAEDLPDASFAGQQETYLNVRGEAHLLEACKKCFASLFTNRAIHYRIDRNFNHFDVSLSIGVQLMVRSDLGSSGIMFSIDTETGFKDAVLINSIYGLGENIVLGRVNPDEFYVHKPTLKLGYKPILSKKLGNKKLKMIYSHEGSKESTRNILTTQKERESYSITEKETLELAKWACQIEDHYKKPMDMEWAKDGKSKKLYIVQARPETIQSRRDTSVLEEYHLGKKGRIITKGRSVGSKIGTGQAQIVKDVHDMKKFRKGNVLVTDMTDPDWEPIMKIAAGIITNRGGRTCHAAIISRELGIPCIVGTNNATQKIKNKQPITVSCAEGETGYIYDGILKYKIQTHHLNNLEKPNTSVMVNLGNPEQAFEVAQMPHEGIGLAREEFIINEYIKIHPKALINFNTLVDKDAKRKIQELTKGYKNKEHYFIDKLSQGVATLAAAFYPKDVIVRLSDFKSNEYAHLIGGKLFEPLEDNPMIGWRGASRYRTKSYKKAFALECKALLKVRKEMGLKNLKIMVPFCRTVKEGKLVLKEMAKNGLKRHKDNLEIYVMCEIPANVILADEFAKIFDGFSIGTNDLTQLTLGLDRDSELVADIYDERNDAVKTLVATAIQKAKANKRHIGLCGEAGSLPDFAQFLVNQGIHSISVAPDALMKTIVTVLNAERNLKRK